MNNIWFTLLTTRTNAQIPLSQSQDKVLILSYHFKTQQLWLTTVITGVLFFAKPIRSCELIILVNFFVCLCFLFYFYFSWLTLWLHFKPTESSDEPYISSHAKPVCVLAVTDWIGLPLCCHFYDDSFWRFTGLSRYLKTSSLWQTILWFIWLWWYNYSKHDDTIPCQ